jgi:Ca2+-transporting ATPase
MDWHRTDIAELFKLIVSSESGLTPEEAKKRLEEYGPNEIADTKKRPPWLLFLNQFRDFMILVLIGAAVISGFLGDLTDTLVIIAIVILNAVVGFVQEYRAGKAMEALRQMAVTNALVVRNNSITTISSSELVPGDVILLEAGNILPADTRLMESVHLKINE